MAGLVPAVLEIAMRRVALAACVLAMLSPAQGGQLIFAYGVSGTCHELTVDATDITAACEANLTQVGYDDGRFGITTFAGDKVITFSGPADEFFGNGLEQPVDMMVLGNSGDDPMLVTARGRCTHGNIFEGAATFDCTAKVKGYRPFRLVFTTDGDDPTDEIAQ
jgi:hypothetical protein